MANVCKDCRFFDPKPKGRSICRRFPPVPNYQIRQSSRPGAPFHQFEMVADFHSDWPAVNSMSWCGEWSPSLDDPAEPEHADRGTGEAARILNLMRDAKAVYDAMSPEEKAAHDQAQRESFARGMMPTGDPRLD